MKINQIYHIPFALKVVYDAWVSGKTVIAPATAMDILPVVGGHYRLTIQTKEYTASNQGKFLIVEPYAHIRYSWQWNESPEVTIIDIQFVASQIGTQIILEHSGFQSPQSMHQHAAGWDSYIQGLTAFLAN